MSRRETVQVTLRTSSSPTPDVTVKNVTVDLRVTYVPESDLDEIGDMVHHAARQAIREMQHRAAQHRLVDRGRERVDGECQHDQWAETCRLCAGIRERRRAPDPKAPDLLEALRRSFETRIAEANARDAARRGQAENETEGQERS